MLSFVRVLNLTALFANTTAASAAAPAWGDDSDISRTSLHSPCLSPAISITASIAETSTCSVQTSAAAALQGPGFARPDMFLPGSFFLLRQDQDNVSSFAVVAAATTPAPTTTASCIEGDEYNGCCCCIGCSGVGVGCCSRRNQICWGPSCGRGTSCCCCISCGRGGGSCRDCDSALIKKDSENRISPGQVSRRPVNQCARGSCDSSRGTEEGGWNKGWLEWLAVTLSQS